MTPGLYYSNTLPMHLIAVGNEGVPVMFPCVPDGYDKATNYRGSENALHPILPRDIWPVLCNLTGLPVREVHP